MSYTSITSKIPQASITSKIPQALPLLAPQWRRTPLYITSKHDPQHKSKLEKKHESISLSRKTTDYVDVIKKSSLTAQLGALLAIVEQPALAVTGMNNEEDLTWVLIQLAIVLFVYFIVVPPIILNWLWRRWYRRQLLEMYLQFMFVFIFFPGIILWAPFLNFRKFPRDPSLKYPWEKPKDPTKVKNAYLKYPFGTPEDYD